MHNLGQPMDADDLHGKIKSKVYIVDLYVYNMWEITVMTIQTGREKIIVS